MTSGYTRQQALDAVAEASAKRDAIQANLLDLDGCFGKELLAGPQLAGPQQATPQLAGVSKQRWDDAQRDLAGLWEIFNAYTAVVERAERLAAGHLGHRELTELSELLTGPSVQIVRATRRGIADTGRDLVTLITARTRMDNAFTLVHDVTDAAERCWNEVAGQLDQAASALAGLDPMGDPALTADMASATERLARERAALNADPLGADRTAAVQVRDDCAALARRADGLTALRAGAAGKIAAIRALADSCRAAQADAAAARQRAVARLTIVPPPVPAAPDPAPRLAELDTLLAAGRWDRLRSELDLLERDLTAVASKFHESERTLVSLLDRRDELRGLLDAYKAKAGRLGAAEDPELSRLYDDARALLWSAPCDLGAASVAVTSYQRAVNGWRIGAR